MNKYIENLAGSEDTADTNREGDAMGSVNHSLVQTRLIRMLPDDSKYTIATELSLDVSTLEIFPWSEGEVIDGLLNIRLPLTKIFS